MSKNQFALLVLVCFSLLKLSAQTTCTPCTTTISGEDSATYTVQTGETFCIAEGAVFTGTLILNGGTLCNMGVFAPAQMTLTSGSFFNAGVCNLKTSIQLNTTLAVTNSETGVINTNGALSIASTTATLVNDGVVNASGTFSYSSGTCTNNGVINCTQVINGAAITGTGTINPMNPN
jgi:hypothetical protein